MRFEEKDLHQTHWPDSGSDLPPLPVSRLIYASISSLAGPVLDEMRRIRDHAVAHNTPQGLRVALAHKGGWFVEWVEGPADGVSALMERVSLDPRHRSLKVVHESLGRPRLVKPWIGSIVDTTESVGEFARRVMALRERHLQGKGFEPATVWRSLCSPLPGHVEVAAAREGGWQRVMMMSARHRGVFDLLHWVASDSGRKVVHRRFAGSATDALDVESDYLDLPDQGRQGRRLIANARKGLAMGMTQAFLPDHSALVVLLDADPALNERLVERLLQACQQVRHQPVIIGVGPDSVFSPRLVVLMAASGMRWVEARTGQETPGPEGLWGALKPVLDGLT